MSSPQLRNDEHRVGNVYGTVEVGGQARVQLGNSYNHTTQNVSIQINSTISTVWKLYKKCRTTPESYYNISQELNSLHAFLKECEEVFPEELRSSDRSARLTIILVGCTDIAEELGAIVQKYESLGLQQRRTWDRLQWHSNEINQIRARITSHVGMLTAFMTTSQLNVARKLEALLLEFRRGNMDGSVVSSVTIDSLNGDERAQWRAVRKEFEEHGITLEMFTSQRNFIFKWFAKAVTAGHFDEERPTDQDTAFLHGDNDSSLDNVQHKLSQSAFTNSPPQASQQSLTPTHLSEQRDSIRPPEPNNVQTHSAREVKTHLEPSADQKQVSATRVPPPNRRGSGAKVSRFALTLVKLRRALEAERDRQRQRALERDRQLFEDLVMG
ncbi:serine palmitoyltransferase component [Lithohypha guttulata]|uniref:serine palmitoyltransferase component n=1 Tax=Lithohypha guttulata TaxID=1690604 RepID=UPI002DE05D48|nr:hypothetical protein LTR51_002729 [Lithohypha guttulata]